MISHLNGTLASKGENFICIDVNGFGVRVYMPFSDIAMLSGIGSSVFVHTYLSVKEDALDLYGFSDVEGLNAFEKLISVNGVGPKAALSILSTLSPKELYIALSSNDSKAISRAQGIGTKIAQRIILELKDKVTSNEVSDVLTTNRTTSEFGSDSAAVNALIALGCSPSAAQKAVVSVRKDDMTTEDIIKAALIVLKS